MTVRFTSLVLSGLVLGSAVPAAAQLRASRPTRPTQNLPRLLVANPHTFQAADSAAAVRVGTGMRDKMEAVADKWYQVITRAQMNDALQQYGYPPDAILPPLVARQLASQLQARAVVLGTFNRDGGKVSVQARVLARNDQTGFILSSSQAVGQSFEDFGGKISESLKPTFSAMPEAINCDNFASTQPDKAIEAGTKAIKLVPTHGLANLCLAQVAIAKKAPADQVIGYYKAGNQGDPQSVELLGGLLGQYQQKSDTANIIDTYKQLIVVAPNNQKVVEEAIRFFILAGKPDLGEQIADDAIGRDPMNPDFHNLKATACLVQEKPEKNLCAIKEMETVFSIDTAKADTLNLMKMLFVASRDSANAPVYLKWAQFATRKFSSNAYFVGELANAYGITGPTDSLVKYTGVLIAMDKTNFTPVIKAIRALFKDKRYKDGVDLGSAIETGGADEDKTRLGLVLAQEAGIPILQTQPVDFALATDVGKKAAGLLKAGSRGHQLASYVVGFGLLGQLQVRDSIAAASKTCEGAGAYEVYIGETKAALTAGMAIQEGTVKERIDVIDKSFIPRVESMKKVYCKTK